MTLPFSQAAENNKDVIGGVLIGAFSSCKIVLEIASGTGQHAVHMAALMPEVIWQTSDLTENHDSITQRLALEAGKNVRPPLALDVAQKDWQTGKIDGVFAANAVHIMSWNHVEALFAGVGKHLAKDGVLALYGPYKYAGEFTTESNARFDQWLKDRDTASGIRDYEAVDGLAQNIGMQLQADHKMPANNQLLIWKRM